LVDCDECDGEGGRLHFHAADDMENLSDAIVLARLLVEDLENAESFLAEAHRSRESREDFEINRNQARTRAANLLAVLAPKGGK
jgi:hypothetical protein